MDEEEKKETVLFEGTMMNEREWLTNGPRLVMYFGSEYNDRGVLFDNFDSGFLGVSLSVV